MTPALLDLLAQRWETANGRLDQLESLETNPLPAVMLETLGAVAGDGTDQRANIQAALALLQTTTRYRTLVFSGEYVISSFEGTGTEATSIVLSGISGVTLRGTPGSKLVIRDGAASRPFLIRSSSDVTIEGLEVSYERTDGLSTDAIAIQNSSDVTVDRCYIHDFPHYGIAVSERTDTWSYGGDTLSFDATSKRILDSANGITGLTVGDIFFVTGSTLNDGRYTVAATDGTGASVTVNETLVTESAAAFKTLLTDSDLTFSASDATIYNSGGGAFKNLEPDMLIRVSGSVSNNRTFTVVDVEELAGDFVRVAQAVVDEAAGATVTIEIQSSPMLRELIATACNDITITNNRIENIGTIGIELFPKVKSVNEIVRGNVLYECGNVSGIGAGIKASSAMVNASITGNLVAHCLTGIAFGPHDAAAVTNNLVLNFSAFGIGKTIGTHFKYGASTFDAGKISGNVVGYTTDFTSITPSNPSGTRFVSTRHVYAGININGFATPTLQFGIFEVSDNVLFNLPCPALGFLTSTTAIANVKWLRNTMLDCNRATAISTVISTGSVTHGSAVITNIQSFSPVKDTTVGWFATSGIFVWTWASAVNTISVPDGTTVIDVDAGTRTLTLSNPVSVVLTSDGVTPVGGAQTGTRISSAYPEGLEVIDNEVRNSVGGGIAGGNFIVYSTNARVLRNTIDNGGIFAIQARGSGMLIDGNEFYNHNKPASGATNAPILLDSAGTFTVRNNHLHSKYPSAVAVTCFVNNNAAQTVLGVSSITVTADDSNTTMEAITKFLTTGVATRLQVMGRLIATATWDPANIADNALATTTVTVSGALVGTPVDVGFTAITAGKWVLRGDVTSTNTVTITLENRTGGAVDLPSGVLTVIVRQL